MIGRHLDRYWLGLASLDDLRTNTLESAAGMLVSQYAGLYNHVSASVTSPTILVEPTFPLNLKFNRGATSRHAADFQAAKVNEPRRILL